MSRLLRDRIAFGFPSSESAVAGATVPPLALSSRGPHSTTLTGSFMGYCGSQAPLSEMSPDVVDLESELGYWRQHYRSLPNSNGLRYRDYEPAIKLGLDAYMRSHGRELPEMEDELATCYRRVRGDSRMEWDQARRVILLAWDHLRHRGSGE